MKKIAAVLAFIIICPAIANADEYSYDYPTGPARDNYIGIRIIKNERAAYDYNIMAGPNYALKRDNMAFSAVVGNRLTGHVRVEFETGYTGASFDHRGSDFEYNIWANMLNIYMFYEYGNAVAPYIAGGAGLAGIWADIDGSTCTKFGMSYQALAGVNFALNERIDLNIGVKYQYYGDVKTSDPRAKTTIDETGIYIGAAYKFGLK